MKNRHVQPGVDCQEGIPLGTASEGLGCWLAHGRAAEGGDGKIWGVQYRASSIFGGAKFIIDHYYKIYIIINQY